MKNKHKKRKEVEVCSRKGLFATKIPNLLKPHVLGRDDDEHDMSFAPANHGSRKTEPIHTFGHQEEVKESCLEETSDSEQEIDITKMSIGQEILIDLDGVLTSVVIKRVSPSKKYIFLDSTPDTIDEGAKNRNGVFWIDRDEIVILECL